MYEHGYKIDEAESKDGSVDIDDGVDFDLNNADEEEADNDDGDHEDKLFGVDLPNSCLFQVEYAEKTFSGIRGGYTCILL